jgi:hypothetical protein
VAESLIFLRDGLTHECKDGVGELLLTWVVAVVGNVWMQDCPKTFNHCSAVHVYMHERGGEMGAVGSDGYDKAVLARKALTSGPLW